MTLHAIVQQRQGERRWRVVALAAMREDLADIGVTWRRIVEVPVSSRVGEIVRLEDAHPVITSEGR
jgi:hypothetical protein